MKSYSISSHWIPLAQLFDQLIYYYDYIIGSTYVQKVNLSRPPVVVGGLLEVIVIIARSAIRTN